MKVALYARVSSERQAEKDLSISAQLKELRRYADRQGFTVVREFVDKAESARTANRPAFQEMIGVAKQKARPFDAILVWKLSRFARNREDSIVYKSMLRKRGIQLISINEQVDDSPTGMLLEGLIEVVDEFYSMNLAQDTKRGLRENAQRGFCNGGIAPYGYRRKGVIDGQAKRSILEPDPETEPIVQEIFAMCRDGLGAKEIAKVLNHRGFQTRSGRQWSKTAILYILRNPIYTGRYVYARNRKLTKGEDRFTIEGRIEPIINKSLFEEAQRLIESRSPLVTAPARTHSEYLLSGLCYCGKCGRALQGGTAKSGRYRYYGCYNHLRRGKTTCDAKLVNAERFEQLVVEKLKERVLTPERLAELLEMTNREIVSQSRGTQKEIDALTREIEARQKKLDRLYAALEDGSLDLADLSPRIKRLRTDIDKLQSTLSEKTSAQASQQTFKPLNQRQLQNYVDDLYDLLSNASVFERRGFLKSFVKRIEVTHPDVKVEYTLPLIREGAKGEVLSIDRKSGPNITLPKLL
ncbi:MAG: recombinase family protein [candidate division Zixibacteria bacterium]|jgi:DNA invertase Pin-like site-specific DNA recombinase|nr:recombinase family protein [candidate division Zixibacteria bacterium]